MEHTKVEGSSNIYSVGYDRKEKLLEVRFQTGILYQYSKFPEMLHFEWEKARFRGEFFARFIRPNYVGKIVKEDE